MAVQPCTVGDVTSRISGLERERRARYAAQREATRVYKDDEGHSWPETAEHFGLSVNAVRFRVYRARKEREAEAAERVQPSLPLEERSQQELSLEE